MMETEKRYIAELTAAYYRGRSERTGLPALSDQERETPLNRLSHDMAEQIRRNAERERQMPEGVIASMLDKLSPPFRMEARHVEWLCI